MKKLLISYLIINYSLVGNGQNIFENDYTKSEATEEWQPMPKIVSPGSKETPPSDAIILFDGKNMDNWVMSNDDSSSQWNLENGAMTVKLNTGDIQTKQKFGDCQLHIEFKIPADRSDSNDLNAGNSGVFMQERYEVQIFDSYHNENIYANGKCFCQTRRVEYF